YLPGYLLITFILIWTNNSFAYLTGKKWGKTFLFPSISPKKTWEGFWGGTIATLIAALLIAYFDTVFNYLQLFILGVSVSILATLGDLVESQFKRLSGVKDSGSLIPGHGGFYDRMDSVIYTAPYMLIIIQLLAYVS
ncbi:MAG: phosphatidate cytidylyltransferase, partial [Flavobacteriaceae bacterium]